MRLNDYLKSSAPVAYWILLCFISDTGVCASLQTQKYYGTVNHAIRLLRTTTNWRF